MDILEITEGHPRTIQQEEEAEAAQHEPLAASELPPVVVLAQRVWNQGLRTAEFPDGIIVQSMVVATSHVSCALVTRAAARLNLKVLGSLLLPECSMRGNVALPVPGAALMDRSCLIYLLPGQAGRPASLLVSCQYLVPAERAHAVCQALMREVCPEKVVVCGGLPGEEFRGMADASQAPVLFSLRTLPASSDETAGAFAADIPPELPPGNVVGGLAAAVLGYCCARSMWAAALVSVDLVPALAPDLAAPFASALSGLLGDEGRAFAGDATACAHVVRKAAPWELGWNGSGAASTHL